MAEKVDDCMPIIDVTTDNFTKIWPAIRNAVRGASFIAVDCELSGLGNRKKLNCTEIDMRYRNTAEVAQQHAVISLGVSCFRCNSVSDVLLNETDGKNAHVKSQDYLVQTFNILTLCTENYLVECAAVKFLVSHGFDFNKQYSRGLPYHRGPDEEKEPWPNVRQVFSTIIEHKKPVVVHNGLVDLMFLYQNFYTQLPKCIDTFAADLSDMFCCGIYDTKYLAEYSQNMPATFLEFLFKKMQLKNDLKRRCSEWHIRVGFPPYPRSMSGLQWHPYLEIHNYMEEAHDDGLDLCESYSFHGWCSKGDECQKSHNINKIVKQLKGSKNTKSTKFSGCHGGVSTTLVSMGKQLKRAKMENENADGDAENKVRRNGNHGALLNSSDENVNTVCSSPHISLQGEANGKRVSLVDQEYSECKKVFKSLNQKESETLQDKTEAFYCEGKKVIAGGHRAGYDAFMTGYIFACHIADVGALTSEPVTFSAAEIGLEAGVNKVYLIGKSIPFLVRKGAFAKLSQNHLDKIKTVRKDILS